MHEGFLLKVRAELAQARDENIKPGQTPQAERRDA